MNADLGNPEIVGNFIYFDCIHRDKIPTIDMLIYYYWVEVVGGSQVWD